MLLGSVCDWIVWDDLFVVGIGADIAGAWMLASSFAMKRPGALAEELVAVTRTYDRLAMGLASYARSVARQKAEAQVGMVFLIGGFALQGTAFLWSHNSPIQTSQHRLVALGLVLTTWIAGVVVWKLYVPWKEAREMAAASLAADALIAADDAD